MAKQLKTVEKSVSEIHSAGDRALDAIHDVSKTLAVERAADRAVAQQVYRMALRAAYLGIKGYTDDVSEELHHEVGMKLCEQADQVYHDVGLPRLEDEMKKAREELRCSIERGGVS